MKILLATDGSKYSKTAINEIPNRPLPHKNEVCIVSVYERMSLINTLEAMGVSHEYYAEVDHNAFNGVEKILRDKNPALIVTTMVIGGSPKSAILKEAESFGADLIIVGSHGHGAIEGFFDWLGFASVGITCKMFCRDYT